ncbi:VapC toxin family PIN domain ribonuclease [Denitratisoma sp. DHT3]|uniref:type II toxin-antitoxin system VapC family toxin n=1 Tax=Denitratisoma sp. DHT3 TaxID=1981880 RepID=UPI00119852FB|nr:type II toxin-antitoxin system VapC family toxin [Denitratisoma sp. DHT3]QDX81810.1 VapC toxin family PIN domain ribonuclease [Denitratisoma sp. DHT3]
MIVLDTNVISEAMKSSADAGVMAWLNAQAAETLYLPSIALAEVSFGLAALPSGKRKSALSRVLDDLLELFEGRILPFDIDAARQYGELAAKAKSAGKGFPTPDGYIAAAAVARGFSVATRDIGPFEAAGVPVINPWVVVSAR